MGVLVFQAWDEDDLNGTPIGTLTDPTDKSVLLQLYGVGAGEFTLSRHSDERQDCRPGRYITVHLDSSANPAIFGFFVTESNNVVLSENEQGAEVLRRRGEGTMSVLADAIVWYKAVTGNDAAQPRNDDDFWHWTAAMGAHPAGVMVRLLEEAQTRGCFPFLTYDFTRDEDSNGDPWTVALDGFKVQVGTDLLTVAGQLQSLGIIFVMDPDFTLHCYETEPTRRGAPSFGTDLSGSLTFEAANNIATAADQVQKASPAKSTVLVRGTRSDNGATAWVEADSAAGLAELKRRKEGLLDAGSAEGFTNLQTMGLSSIYSKLRLGDGSSYLGIYDTTNVPFDDYALGDTVLVDVPGVWDEVERVVMSIAFTDTESGEYDVVVGFDQAPQFASGGSSSVVPTRPPGPGTPVDDDDMADRAADTNAVRLNPADSGTPVIVQDVSPTIGGDTNVVLDDPPTPGNILVLWHAARDLRTPETPTGFIAVGTGYVSSQFSSGNDQDRARWFYRIVQEGDSDTITGVTDGSGVKHNVYVAEISGTTSLDSYEELEHQSQSGTDVEISHEPTAGIDGILLAGFTMWCDSAGSSFAPDGSSTELHDYMPAGGHPLSAVVYREITAASGSYTLGGDSSTTHNGGWGAQSIMLTGGEESWSINAPEVVDGDDATYETITGTDLLRIDLGAAYRIVRTRIRIAATNAGARTFTIKGANLADFSDEASLATIAFTATGSLTAQDVTGLWLTNTAYRYFELSIGTSDTYRVHTWELYEETPGSSIVTDPTNGDAAAPLQDVLDNLDAAIDDHLTDTTDVHDHGSLSGLSDNDHPQYARAAYGGQEILQSHGAAGSSETIDLANGNYHAVTLDDDCTFSFTGSVAGRLCSFTLELTEDGTGGHTPTWPGSVVWIGGTPVHDTTASTTTFYLFHTRDNGTTWFGAQVGAGGASTGYPRPLMAYDPDDDHWYVVVDGEGTAVMVTG